MTARTRGAAAQSITRDDDGRIESVVGVAGYVYDETGERARKTGTGAGDTLYVDREYEVDLVGATHGIHYFHGSRRVATETRSGLGLPGGGGSGSLLGRQFYFPDFVGSNAVVAKSDGTLQKSFLRPFGEFAQEGGGMTPYLFTDQEHDPETGLQYFGARYYDPWVGRFLGPDPELISARAGITFRSISGNPQQFNAYSYALNAPTVFTDPTGAFVSPESTRPSRPPSTGMPASVTILERGPSRALQTVAAAPIIPIVIAACRLQPATCARLAAGTAAAFGFGFGVGGTINLKEQEGGDAPAREADLAPGKSLEAGGELSTEDAVEEVKNGGDVIAKDRSTARDIARQAGGGEPIHEQPGPRAGPSGKPHFHPATPSGDRLPGHVFY